MGTGRQRKSFWIISVYDFTIKNTNYMYRELGQHRADVFFMTRDDLRRGCKTTALTYTDKSTGIWTSDQWIIYWMSSLSVSYLTCCLLTIKYIALYQIPMHLLTINQSKGHFTADLKWLILNNFEQILCKNKM